MNTLSKECLNNFCELYGVIITGEYEADRLNLIKKIQKGCHTPFTMDLIKETIISSGHYTFEIIEEHKNDPFEYQEINLRITIYGDDKNRKLLFDKFLDLHSRYDFKYSIEYSSLENHIDKLRENE